jgi:archaellum component FlaF (FlaF/FlaG flagellin family)
MDNNTAAVYILVAFFISVAVVRVVYHMTYARNQEVNNVYQKQRLEYEADKKIYEMNHPPHGHSNVSAPPEAPKTVHVVVGDSHES